MLALTLPFCPCAPVRPVFTKKKKSQVNFLLKNLELELDERYLLVGEKLLEQGKVSRLYESERNLWIAQIEQFEAEMQISPSRVRACSCECEVFRANNMCGHLAAGLLALRRRLSEKTAERPASPARQPYQKLTTSSILASVQPDELAAFVGQYAKHNRNFALALKARFASSVPMFDSKEKYAQLLDTTIQALRKKDGSISVASGIQLHKTLVDLLGQAGDAISLEHFSEAWAILQNILVKITPLLRKIDGEDDNFKPLISNVLDKIKILLGKSIPPSLREEAWSFLLEDCNRPAYRIHGFSTLIFKLLNLLADDADKAADYLQLLENELNRKALAKEYHASALYAKLILLEKQSLKKEAGDFLLECLAHPDLLLQTVEAAIANGVPEKVKHLAEKGLRFAKDQAARMKLESVLLSVSMTENAQDDIVQNARQLFLETYDLAYFRLCKQNFTGAWLQFFKELEDALVAQNAPGETMAALFAEDGQWEPLLKTLEQVGSLELLAQYRHLLVKNHGPQLLSLYKKLLDTYLSNHIGIKPSIKVQGILAQLHEMGAHKVASGLHDFLLEKYPARLAPIEEAEAL
jgi:hypothetical protein